MDNIFSKRLITARENAKLKQNQAAKLLKVAPITLNRYEMGHREPDRELVEKMAALYRCDLVWLLTGEEPGRRRDELTQAEQDVLELIGRDREAVEMLETYFRLPKSKQLLHRAKMLEEVEELDKGSSVSPVKANGEESR